VHSALIGTVPPTATVTSMADVLLDGLGDVERGRSPLAAKTRRVVLLCRGCRVELLLLDEAQHLHDRGDTRTHYLVGDWLKHLIDEVGVPTVLLGLPRLEQLLMVNEQLRRRFSRRIRLALGQSETETIETECWQLFHSLTRCMEVEVRADPYGWQEMGTRLYYASDGRVSYIKRLLSGALRQALENRLDVVTAEVLEGVFARDIWNVGIGPLNPFNEKFQFRRLDRGGEPFESGHASTRRRAR